MEIKQCVHKSPWQERRTEMCPDRSTAARCNFSRFVFLLEKRQQRLARAASAKDVLTVLIVEVTGARLLLGFQPLLGKREAVPPPKAAAFTNISVSAVMSPTASYWLRLRRCDTQVAALPLPLRSTVAATLPFLRVWLFITARGNKRSLTKVLRAARQKGCLF